ncbi:MAG: hypothetical protein GX863_10875 [Firmicutes bacterium]|nr:hypothetical protein [Candidatus Fermentithermobacillaceae bacterium]
MDRLPGRLGGLFSGASDIPWSALAAELRRLGFVVEQSKKKATHWIDYYPDLPDTPMQTVVVDRGAVRKPKYLSMLRNLVRAVLDLVEEDGFE